MVEDGHRLYKTDLSALVRTLVATILDSHLGLQQFSHFGNTQFSQHNSHFSLHIFCDVGNKLHIDVEIQNFGFGPPPKFTM